MPPKGAVMKRPAARQPEPVEEPEEVEDENEAVEEEEEEEEEGEEEEEAEEEEPEESPQKATGRGARGATAAGAVSRQATATSPAQEQRYEESAAQAAARAMSVVSPADPSSGSAAAEPGSGGGGSPQKAASAAASPVGGGGDRSWAVVTATAPARLHVVYQPAALNSSRSLLVEGLVTLRRLGKCCDIAVVCGASRVPIHRAVLASHSEVLMTQSEGDLDLTGATFEAVDILIRWLYGEVDTSNYTPTTAKVNEEVLKFASDFVLPALADLCGARLAADVDTSNVVSRIKLCEQFGLPELRAALVAGIIEDSPALAEVARDPATLGHPPLMRELLTAIAQAANLSVPAAKKQRTA